MVSATSGVRRARPVLIVAGEVSGDLRAAGLMRELRELGDFRFFGLGGDAMVGEGITAVAHSNEIAVVGLIEALRVIPRARRIFGRLLREARRIRPEVAILVDAPDFNLRLAAKLSTMGIPVVYYVSPQVWAWRQGRVRTIARVVDLMLVLFPFEADFYDQHEVSVVHVGHPLVDEIAPQPQAWDQARPDSYRVVLLPGSRISEVEALLPGMLDAIGLLAKRLPIQTELLVAPGLDRRVIERLMRSSGREVPLVDQERERHIAAAHLALCASGTATLEVGLLGTPMIVLYRMGALTYRLARRLVKVPHVSLVNLVLGERAVPELIQHDAEPESIAAQAHALLADPNVIATIRGKLSRLRAALGAGGASKRAAEAVVSFLERQDEMP
jgi:lipid-A-disaccharide synthase